MPEALVRYVWSKEFRGGLDRTDLAAVERLFTALDMEKVWAAIGELDPDRHCERRFLNTCIGMRSRWRRISKLGAAEIRSTLVQIAEGAEKLARLMRDAENEIALQGTPLSIDDFMEARFRSPELSQYLLAYEDRELLSPSPPLRKSQIERFLAEIDSDDGGAEIQYARFEWLTFPILLEEFAASLKAPMHTARAIVRQTKPNDPNAERTFYTRILALFFLDALHSPRYDLVAYALTAFLDLDPPLTLDLAGKNARRFIEDVLRRRSRQATPRV